MLHGSIAVDCSRLDLQADGRTLFKQIGDKINQRGAQSGSLREVYRKFDEDKSGKVDFRELRNGAVLIVVLTPLYSQCCVTMVVGGWLVVIRVAMDLRQQRSKSHFRHSGQGGLDYTLPQHSCPTSRRGVRVTVRPLGDRAETPQLRAERRAVPDAHGSGE